MTNLNEMKAKELKEMAKGFGVKNWWNLKKSELIDEIVEAIAEREDAGEDVDVDTMAETAIEEAAIEETTKVVKTEETIEAVEGEDLDTDEETTKVVKKPSLGINSIEFNGKMQSLKAWAEELEMPWPTLYDRINRNGWTIEEALTIPLGGRRKKRV